MVVVTKGTHPLICELSNREGLSKVIFTWAGSSLNLGCACHTKETGGQHVVACLKCICCTAAKTCIDMSDRGRFPAPLASARLRIFALTHHARLENGEAGDIRPPSPLVSDSLHEQILLHG